MTIVTIQCDHWPEGGKQCSLAFHEKLGMGEPGTAEKGLHDECLTGGWSFIADEIGHGRPKAYCPHHRPGGKAKSLGG